ncbi:unnamed protein product [Pleuronectes platessa]|uniref:Uncharacterized protein n=1 Tax=Pleuronectes platessa TaxID=8262 RepID=A0A9N7Y571_PLEPL|nr:unnamed protein product [Pleuronectes platessa]
MGFYRKKEKERSHGNVEKQCATSPRCDRGLTSGWKHGERGHEESPLLVTYGGEEAGTNQISTGDVPPWFRPWMLTLVGSQFLLDQSMQPTKEAVFVDCRGVFPCLLTSISSHICDGVSESGDTCHLGFDECQYGPVQPRLSPHGYCVHLKIS